MSPVLWPPHARSWLIGKDPDAGRDWGQEEKGMTEDEMAGWHHWLNGCESEWILRVGDGQGGLACCNSLGRKESDMTERLNWTELKVSFIFIWIFPIFLRCSVYFDLCVILFTWTYCSCVGLFLFCLFVSWTMHWDTYCLCWVSYSFSPPHTYSGRKEENTCSF